MAESAFVAKLPSGEEEFAVAQIGFPRQTEDAEWECEVEIPNLDKRRSIRGVDGLQAIQLAAAFLVTRLENLIENGVQLLSTNTRKPISAREVVPQALTDRL